MIDLILIHRLMAASHKQLSVNVNKKQKQKQQQPKKPPFSRVASVQINTGITPCNNNMVISQLSLEYFIYFSVFPLQL